MRANLELHRMSSYDAALRLAHGSSPVSPHVTLSLGVASLVASRGRSQSRHGPWRHVIMVRRD